MTLSAACSVAPRGRPKTAAAFAFYVGRRGPTLRFGRRKRRSLDASRALLSVGCSITGVHEFIPINLKLGTGETLYQVRSGLEESNP